MVLVRLLKCMLEDFDKIHQLEPADGKLIDICDKTICISKSGVKTLQISPLEKFAPIKLISQMSHKFSQTYCCAKGMRPLALETSLKQDCFKNQILGWC
jgi:hypothetical protein